MDFLQIGTAVDCDVVTATEDEIETEYNDSEFEGSERRSVAFTANSSNPPSLNPLDSSSDDYRFTSGK